MPQPHSNVHIPSSPLSSYFYFSFVYYLYTTMPFRNHGTIGTRYETMTQAWPKCKTMIDDCQTAAPGSNACAQAQSYCNAQMLGPYEATGLNPYDIREPCKVKPLCYDFTDVEKWYVRGRGCNWNTQYAQYAQYAVCSMQYAVHGDRQSNPQYVLRCWPV